jgi:hypothetical protein
MRRVKRNGVSGRHFFASSVRSLRIHGLSPIARRGSLPSQIQLIYGRCSRQRNQHPACGGQGLRRTRPFYQAAFEAILNCGSFHLDPPGLIGSWKIAEFGCDRDQGVFVTAPSMTTPALTYFHSATISLRASATIVFFFRRPSFCFTRCLNHRLSAECC